jgi:IQ motif and SEC7 domain-containing protein
MLDPEIYKIITHDQYGGYRNQQIKPNKHSHHHTNNNNNNNNNGNSKNKNHLKNHNTNGIDSDDNGNVDLKKYTVVYVGDGRSRVRRVVRSHTRHVTVVSYSPRSKETSSHTSHHVTTVR